MATPEQIRTCQSILKATFLSCLDVLNVTELSDAISHAEGHAIVANIKETAIPLIFTDSSRRFPNKGNN